jgi:2-methylcitrate dehydratase PrpD
MIEKTLAEELSEFIVATDYEKLPADVAHKTKRFFMNHLGCVLGAKGNESSEIVVRTVSALGGEKQSTIIGYGLKTSSLNAALANGVIGYALEMNDDHKVAVAHPVVATAPAALAIGERDHLHGLVKHFWDLPIMRVFISQAIVGYSVRQLRLENCLVLMRKKWAML